MLIKGLEALEKVKKQWEDGEVFPNDLQLNQILPDLSVKVFVDMADDNQKISSYSSKVFAAELIYRHLFNASSTVQLVTMISKAYHTSVTKELMKKLVLEKKTEFEKCLEMREVLPASGDAELCLKVLSLEEANKSM
uniref:Uncharacterized protein n=1 Tax=Sphaerodactylus townsendi TaxID=933632 RepID=A0ACB8GDH0_9SAUR